MCLLALRNIACLSELCFRFNFKVGDVRMLSNRRASLLFLISAHFGVRELEFSESIHIKKSKQKKKKIKASSLDIVLMKRHHVPKQITVCL